MWERFMTKPLVDSGVFRRVADCPTPWPCFVIAVRDEVLAHEPEIIKEILQIINRQTQTFKEIPGIATELAQKFNQKQNDIAQWLTMTEWSQQPPSEDVLNKVQNQLLELSLIRKKATFAEIVSAL